jgi:hypothetical protein
MKYSAANYFELGRVAPRDELRSPYRRPFRAALRLPMPLGVVIPGPYAIAAAAIFVGGLVSGQALAEQA